MSQITEKELNSFLDELKDKEELAKIAAQEAAELEELYPGENLASDNAWGWAKAGENEAKFHRGRLSPHLNSDAKAIHLKTAEKGRAAVSANAKERKKLKKEIIEEALLSETIDLNAPLTVWQKQQIVLFVTKNASARLTYWEGLANKLIEKALKKQMPRDLMESWRRYRSKLIPFDSFEYKASKEYGQELTFKATPDLPDYFKPEACQNIVYNALSAQELMLLDKAIVSFHKFKEKRTSKEIATAAILVKIRTLMDLLNKKPLWYKHIIELGDSNAEA